ncbi:MAG TPA: NAD(P)H-binding protein [Gaiellaceae bacterium]|nr:NAD(P)H-binding protein [Gaiellaceae bacterium]
MTIAVAGATGYIGRALIERALSEGSKVRALSRDASKLPPREGLTVVEGDLENDAALDELLVPDCVAYFLVHGLTESGDLVERERDLATRYGAAAERNGVARIVYLGGLVDETESDLSPHMQGRLAAGRALRESPVQTIEFRASIVIGRGSFSFALIEKLVRFVPVIALPSWADNLAQPIADEDVVAYLLAAADVDLDGDTVIEIGGADQLSYRDLVELVARLSGSPSTTVSMPVPGIVSKAAAPLVDQLPGDAQEALKLLESLKHASVVTDATAEGLFAIQPMSVEAAVLEALAS